MKFKSLVILPVFFVLLCYAPVLGAPIDDITVDVYVNTEDCPLQVLTLWTKNSTESFEFPVSFGYELSVECTSECDQNIVAWEAGIVIFDAFDEYLYTLGIFSSDPVGPGGGKSLSGITYFPSDFTSLTFFVWIDKIRYADGSLYFADISMVVEAVEGHFSVSFPEQDAEINEFDWRVPVIQS